MRNLANFVLFQIGWFACVLGAANDAVHVGWFVTVVVVFVHFLVITRERRREQVLVGCVTVAGSFVTALNVALGAVSFPGALVAYAGVPYFILLLWILFGTLLVHSLAWLQNRLVLAAVLSAIGSPLSYRAADAMGAVAVNPDFVRGPLVLGLTWALAVPIALFASRHVVRGEADQPSSNMSK